MVERKTGLNINGRQRRDGKYSVTVSFPGGPNAFGGFYPTHRSTSLMTVEKLLDWASKPYVEVLNPDYLPKVQA